MAKKRMINIDIVGSDAFLEMEPSSQCLYFHLNQRADDEGFIANAKSICRECRCSNDDLEALIKERFILDLGNGIYVIKHWKINNTINRDRFTPTTYTDKREMLILKKNKAYALKCYESGNTDKNSIDKNSIDYINNVQEDIDIEDLPFYVGDEEIENIENEDDKSDPVEENKKTGESLEEFFEKIWKLYPIKKGKGQVSVAKKKVLQRIGYEEIARCVERYISEFGDNNRKYMYHGSTFFNSGYVDYLDCNYDTENNSNLPPNSVQNETNEEITDNEPIIDLWSDL